MKRNLLVIVITIIFFLQANSKPKDYLTIKITTASKSKNVVSNYKVEKWHSKANLLQISFINKGKQTEVIKDVIINLNQIPTFNKESRFLYGGYDMGTSPIQQYAYDQKQSKTESVLLCKNGDKNFFKVGILTWEIFRASISFSKENGISITSKADNKSIKPGETVYFEKIIVEEGTSWQDLLFDYGKQIAKIQQIKPKEIGKWKGWGSWDYYGHNFTEKDIKSNIEQIKALNVGANVIQLDASWWINRGDYLETRSTLPSGMKGIAKMITDNGFIAGLHLDGMRGVSTAKIFKEHPEWFLKDQDGNTIYGPYSGSEKPEKRVYFDYSNPEACRYIKNVLHTMTSDWGYKYIKIDFLRYGLDADIFKAQKDTSLKKIVAFDTTMTSMERTRAGLKAMREGIGEAFFLSCSSVFGPNYGLVDGLRTGADISPRFESFTSHSLQNAGNFYLNSAVVQTDADYIVVRNKDDEDALRAQGRNKFGGNVTLNEAAMWADYVMLFGGIKLSSDDINLLRPERKELLKSAFAINTCTRFMPIDLWDKAKHKEDAFNIMLGENDMGVYLALFNWGDKELEFNLSNVPTNKIEAIKSLIYSASSNKINVKLKSHTSAIFKLNKTANFNKVRKQVTYKLN